MGKCFKNAKDCKYSHEAKNLQKEMPKRLQELENSKYYPRDRRPPNHQNIPTSILKRDHTFRAMDTDNNNNIENKEREDSDTYIEPWLDSHLSRKHILNV
jgi:hypothetical protein